MLPKNFLKEHRPSYWKSYKESRNFRNFAVYFNKSFFSHWLRLYASAGHLQRYAEQKKKKTFKMRGKTQSIKKDNELDYLKYGLIFMAIC